MTAFNNERRRVNWMASLAAWGVSIGTLLLLILLGLLAWTGLQSCNSAQASLDDGPRLRIDALRQRDQEINRLCDQLDALSRRFELQIQEQTSEIARLKEQLRCLEAQADSISRRTQQVELTRWLERMYAAVPEISIGQRLQLVFSAMLDRLKLCAQKRLPDPPQITLAPTLKVAEVILIESPSQPTRPRPTLLEPPRVCWPATTTTSTSNCTRWIHRRRVRVRNN